ncbi:MAG: cbb3-type cytochrome oxidase subunit 3 [Phycisphaerales bacterium]
MSLTDIMSSMQLSAYPQIALGLFLIVFASIVWRTWSKKRRGDMQSAAMLPLEDE